MTTYTGISIVEGLGYGKAHFIGRALKDFKIQTITQDLILDEIEKFDRIRDDVKTYYREYRESLFPEDGVGPGDNVLIQIYEHMIDDPAFTGQVVRYVTSKKYSLESAIRSVSKEFIERFNAADTSYFRERGSDMVEICEKLIACLHGEGGEKVHFTEDVILVVNRSLTPSDLINYDLSHVKGVVSIAAGKTSHAAILARSYAIPVVSGIENLTDIVAPDVPLMVDAYTGLITVHPEETAIKRYYEYVDDLLLVKEQAKRRWHVPVYSRDGVPVSVMANISFESDVEFAGQYGADGIGLVRTEYLLSERETFPTEDEQFAYYTHILNSMKGKESIIRMMDIGGDKAAKFLRMPKEENPFMGWRAVRILLEREDLFTTQLRAILRAGAGKNYKIMFPMVTAISEWKQLRAFTIKVAADLGIPCPPLGILFEVPLAILEMGSFLKEIEFASIGTNDLLQYLSAADRNNAKVSYLYNPLEPAFLKIIKGAIESCKDKGIPISICGEMAGNPVYTLLLIGLGLTRFSVIPSNIPVIKELISCASSVELREEIAHILTLDTSEAITDWVDNINTRVAGSIFKRYHIGAE